jgi:sec-independent protein translocase protein TatA
MGFLELLLLVLVVFLFFGASKLPALGEGLGKAIRGFRTAVRDDRPAAASKQEQLPGGREER